MATADAPQPFTLKDVILSIEGDDYAAHVSEVRFVPSSSDSNWQGLTPTATFTDSSISTWASTWAYAQDWSNPDSLSFKLHNEEGETKLVLFTPKKGSGQPAVEATVVFKPGEIGGAVNGWATGTVTLAVVGKPKFIPAV